MRKLVEEALVRYRKTLLSIGWRHLHSNEGAEDVYQNTCVCALERYHQLKDQAKVGAWLTTIARSFCFRVIRANEQHGPIVELRPNILEGRHEPESAKSLLEKVLERLTGEDREMVRLHFHEKLDWRQVAWRMGVPAGALRARWHRKKKLLSRLFKEDGMENPVDEKVVSGIDILWWAQENGMFKCKFKGCEGFASTRRQGIAIHGVRIHEVNLDATKYMGPPESRKPKAKEVVAKKEEDANLSEFKGLFTGDEASLARQQIAILSRKVAEVDREIGGMQADQKKLEGAIQEAGTKKEKLRRLMDHLQNLL